MPACRSLKMAYQSGPVSLSIAATAPLVSPAPYMRPGREQRRGQIGDRAADRLRQVAARRGILLVLERVHAEHQPGDAVVLVGLHDALGKFHRFVDVAVDQQRQEGAVEQFAVFRIAPERGAVIGGGRGGVALLAGMAGGEITARGRHAGKVRRGRRLRGKLDRRRHQECGKRGAGGAPGEARKSHGRCSNEADDRGFRASRRGWAENGLFAPPPQERRPSALKREVENLDVAASWPQPAAAHHIFG